MVLLDKERDIGIFSVSNVWTFIADYAGNSLYQVMKGEQINGIVKKCAVREYPKSVIDRYQAAW